MSNRHCYWHPDYVSPAPFCLSSKMTECENQLFDDFQDILRLEKVEKAKIEVLARFSISQEDNLAIDGQPLRSLLANKVKYFSFSDFLKESYKPPQGVCTSNTQTIAAIEAKTRLIRSNYLAR